MDTTLFVVVGLAFAMIGLLPIIFFDRDRDLNVRWWLTALPFFVAPLAVAAAFFGPIQPWPLVSLLPYLAPTAATLAAAGAIALIAYTLGTHSRPLALWHQNNDAPAEIVTTGAYRHLRHPFYTAFLMTLAAAFLAAPSIATLGCLPWSGVALSVTARREEKRLLASRFGSDYSAYMERTGRFLPRLR